MWTYDPTELATNPMMQVRYLTGDSNIKSPQVQDEEITFSLSVRSSIWGAAAEVCRAISTNFAREVDNVQGDMRVLYSQRSRNYAARARDYETMAAARGGGMPYAGGISIFDKDQQVLDLDRVLPQFNIGMEDNPLPIGQAGNETENQPGGEPAPSI